MRGVVRGIAAAWRRPRARWWLPGAALLVGGVVALLLLSGWVGSSSSEGGDSVERAAEADAGQGETPDPGGDDSPVAGLQDRGSADDKNDSAKGDPASEARGSIHEIAEVKESVVADPVGIDETAEFGNGVHARISSVEAIEAEAFLPGEFSGPAVALTVEVTNGSSETINLDTVTVDLVYGDNLSASPVTDPERTPLSGHLGAGDTTAGDYVFTLAPKQRGDVQVRISYAAETPTVVFAGSVADG